MPTYKRSDTSNKIYVNKNEQCPSYTDRILFKNNTQSKVVYHEYNSVDD